MMMYRDLISFPRPVMIHGMSLPNEYIKININLTL